MPTYSLPTYDKYREWIREARENGLDWDAIKFAGGSNEEELQANLLQMNKIFYRNISCEDWYNLVNLQIEAEKKTIQVKYNWQQAILKGVGQDNDTSVPKDPHSSWQLYKHTLLEKKHFREDVVDNIEQSVIKILRRLSIETPQDSPVKGLAIGNVQSGKTGNMAGLMAMAADWGWNLFIILSGTIENLREQNENRIYEDLNVIGNLSWKLLNHPSKRSPSGDRASDLHFENESNERYFTVCLKNSTRLKNLIQWLQKDVNKQQQMRILVIDDEADQASIDTLDISKDEKNAINRLITNLVNGKNESDKPTKAKFCGMNYIGYTATPYANILNDSAWESLYPHNFITTLGISNEYFGPQQIFGVDGEDFDGLDITREVSTDELQQIKDIHDGIRTDLPESLKDAICWFCCGVATQRLRNYRKPVSMLIHTSQRTIHHNNIGTAIISWLKSADKNDLLMRCKQIWNRETTRFSLIAFSEQYPDYANPEDEPGEDSGASYERIKKIVNDYPAFEDIEEKVKYLISEIPTPIMLGDDGELTYHNGIHICIDNCHNSGVNQEGMHLRLAYPDANAMPDETPAFIVIGGATLARGLTIEGLISTYFLRSVGQADTLMQMGRWFGYRKGYELLPRIWITSKTQKQFRFLSNLDQDLREEIIKMDVQNISPDNYGPKVRNTPSYQFIRITAKNKMQSAQNADMDYTGSFNQTYLFDTDIKVLNENLTTVCSFIESLGIPDPPNSMNKYSMNAAIWRGITITKIKDLIRRYHFHKNLHFGQNLPPYLSWLEQVSSEGKLDDWNVIVSGGRAKTSEKSLQLRNCTIAKVTRTRKVINEKREADPSVNDIGVLSDPRDFLADIPVNAEMLKENSDLKNLLEHFNSKASKIVRNSTCETTPQLIIYIVDKDSKSHTTSRVDLDSKCDLAGLAFNIPGGKRGENYAATLSIRLKDHEEFADEGDIETDGY